MRISILTLFPDMFVGPFDASIVKRAKEKKLVELSFHNIRDFASDSYKTVDDKPYGGGAGMVMRVDVVDRALAYVRNSYSPKKTRTVLLDPQGSPYTQKTAQRLSQIEHLILVCGHYEGIDARIRALVDEELSIGDYVLTGGEIPAMVVVDSIVRLLPGVLKKTEATLVESFSGTPPLLEFPQYTRPAEYKGKSVPTVLLSGNHQDIARWRDEQAVKNTKNRRSDLLSKKKKS